MPVDQGRGLLIDDEEEVPTLRKTFLLAIGIDQYQHLRALNNAKRDAETVVQTLVKLFDCTLPDFAPPLFDQEATRSKLGQRFRALTREFKKEAFQHNLIIYFAGHGEWDEDFEAGYWALYGAKGKDLSTYYSNAELVTAIKAIKSHHTLVISDSCFSGGLVDTSPRRSNRKESLRSRYVLASGLKDETVSDGPPGTHSPFAQSILDFLKQNQGSSFRVSQLEDHLETHFLQKNTKQEPIFAPLNVPDNQFGQLWLHPRFDVVQELNRLIQEQDHAGLDRLIQTKSNELKARKKLKHAREKLEHLDWHRAQEVKTGIGYLTYLQKHLHARNDHPEQALALLGNWVNKQQGEGQDLEEEIAHWQSRYEQAKKERDLARKTATEEKAENTRLTAQLQNRQDRIDQLQQEKREWEAEKQALLNKMESLRDPRIEAKENPKPRFDFPLPELIHIEGGTFQMGSEEGRDNEKPIHQVTLDSFELGKYPVTQREWQAIMGDNPSRFKGDDRPVESVSWNDCQAFIKKLNQKTGMTFRLPTEAEWEYAAGGGAENRTCWAGTNSESELGKYAWYDKNSDSQTQPIGQKQPNALGLYDLSGNVWEWCQDGYGGYPESPQTNPTGPSDGSNRVYRGGSWSLGAERCRVARRSRWYPGLRSRGLGFRLARTL